MRAAWQRALLPRLLLALSIACLSVACTESRPRPRNLVLISLDTMAPAHMSLYGHERDTTPTLRQLAASGVVFSNAYATSPWTLPSHASMLSGRYPTSLSPDPTDRRLYAGAPLLAELFAQQGYRTAAVTGGGFVSAEHGADRGFESFRERAGVPAVLHWIEEHATEPFFFFFHTYKAHTPYNDRRFARGLEAGRLAGLYGRGPKAKRRRLHHMVVGGTPKLDQAEQEYVRSLYDGGIARADELVAEILEGLERLGLADSTAVVVTSDHGEEFWQHTKRGASHGHTLHDELLRIPMVWYEPALGRAGSVVDDPVSLIDIVPTVAARFDLDTPSGLDGEDLSPLIDNGTWQVDRYLVAEGARNGKQKTAVMGKQGKLIEVENPNHNGGRPRHRLYFPDDPEETRDRARDAPRRTEELLDALATHRADATDAAPAAEIPELSEQARKRLRELGYVE